MSFTSLGFNVFSDIITTDDTPTVLFECDLNLDSDLIPYGFGAVSNHQKFNINILAGRSDGYADAASFEYSFTTHYDNDGYSARIIDATPLRTKYHSDLSDGIDLLVDITIESSSILTITITGIASETYQWTLYGIRKAIFTDLDP